MFISHEFLFQRLNCDLNNSEVKRKPKDLKIIVDSMMLGLGKHLRRYFSEEHLRRLLQNFCIHLTEIKSTVLVYDEYFYSRCGIDTILAETRNYLIECAERDPNRYIITCGRAVDEVHFFYY